MKLACGIDMHARTSQICVIDQQHTKLVECKLPSTPLEVISVLEPFKEAELSIVIESTFYWYRMVDGLMDALFDVHLAHTLGLSYITQAKVKTDRRDAFKLAQLLMAGLIPEAYIYPKEIRPVRDLLRQRHLVVARRAEEYRSLQNLLLQQGNLDAKYKDLQEAYGEEQLEEFFNDPFIRMHAQHELERVDLLSEQIHEKEVAIREEAQQTEDYHRLMQMPGIGEMWAQTILYEIGCIERFRDERHFSSYSRVVPGTADSANTSKRGRGSKQGNPHLKYAFSQAAVAAVRCYPQVGRYFNKQLRKHKGRYGKLISYNNVAHRLAIACFHILRRKTDYDMRMQFGK